MRQVLLEETKLHHFHKMFNQLSPHQLLDPVDLEVVQQKQQQYERSQSEVHPTYAQQGSPEVLIFLIQWGSLHKSADSDQCRSYGHATSASLLVLCKIFYPA